MTDFTTGLPAEGKVFSARQYRAEQRGRAGDGAALHAFDQSRDGVRFKTAHQFVAEYVPLAYVIEPAVRSSTLYSLTAVTGAGKTGFLVAAALAIATGRSDILGVEVEVGRVAYCAFENADDVRMRIGIAAFMFNIDLKQLADRLIILDERRRPEEIAEQLGRESRRGPFRLVAIDTFAAAFDGKDVNSPVEAGEFMRRIRPLTRLPGLQTAVVACHPVKGAGADQLVPYGSGAILNEVDGNLTLWKKPDTGIVSLHWQGKWRGLDFKPATYRFEVAGSPEILDIKGRQVQLPYLTHTTLSEADQEAKEKADASTRIALLRAIQADPKGSQRAFAAALEISKIRVHQLLTDLKSKRLIDNPLGPWSLTSKGEKELEKWGQ